VQGDRALAIEPEVMQDGGGVITGIETNVMSWGQFWSFTYVPLVAAYKALDPRHLQRTTDRWSTNKTDPFQTSFFNGMGFASCVTMMMTMVVMMMMMMMMALTDGWQLTDSARF
jgi:hypothetical protein